MQTLRTDTHHIPCLVIYYEKIRSEMHQKDPKTQLTAHYSAFELFITLSSEMYRILYFNETQTNFQLCSSPLHIHTFASVSFQHKFTVILMKI